MSTLECIVIKVTDADVDLKHFKLPQWLGVDGKLAQITGVCASGRKSDACVRSLLLQICLIDD